MLKSIANFYSKYRTVILVTILVFSALQLVNVFVQNKLHANAGMSQKQSISTVSSQINQVPVVESPSESNQETEEPTGWIMWFPVIFISVAASLIYLFQNWKGIDKLFPGYVLMRAGIVGSRRSGILKWQISLSNQKRQRITFSDPIIIFSNFTTTKKFKINSNDFTRSFPISVEPKTRYQLTIELNQFYTRHPELVKSRFVRTQVTASNGKIYKSLWKIIVVKMG